MKIKEILIIITIIILLILIMQKREKNIEPKIKDIVVEDSIVIDTLILISENFQDTSVMYYSNFLYFNADCDDITCNNELIVSYDEGE